ncbi:MAG: hypothetical protein KAX65_04130 [Caldilineaceae bacterium]|nr:hypothetical protein [Caldilineaceae bacterium]
MPVKLKDLKKATKKTTFPYGADSVTLTYRPAAITPRVQFVAGALVALSGKQVDLAGLAPEARNAIVQERMAASSEAIGDYLDMLTEIIVTWDVLGDDGKPLPVTADIMADFPYEFINALFAAVQSGGSDPN